MSHKSIAARIRAAVVGVALVLIALFALIIVSSNDGLLFFPDEHARVAVWRIFSFGGFVPCVIALVLGWLIAAQVTRDRSFSRRTATLLRDISTCAFAEAGYIFLGNVLIAIFRMEFHHGGLILACAMLILIALAVAMAFAALARFVQKAAELQEESDLTV
ncbi:MAG: DUF2975 domain-containing protein [Oscillospiraceae bacterium]|jgi:hypothetical protein|nr:DUF2975 domain-containing protein [Oscillospiraceae bacterium]